MKHTRLVMTRSLLLLLALLLGSQAARAQQTYTVRYSYDAQGRLTEATYDAATRITYTYDANSNRLTRTVDTPVAVEASTELPTRFALHGNYPNPFNPATTLHFDLPETATVRVEVFDLLGRAVLVQPPQNVAAGFERAVLVQAASLASGVYFYRLRAEAPTRSWTTTGRFVLIK